MEYGCIGEHLGHSFSKEIHARLASYEYTLREISRDGLSAFMTEKPFKAINVTIPYKKDVIPYLDAITDEAKAIGAVNTIVNHSGKLYGYNTDFYGIKATLLKMGFESLEGKKVLILGTGGTSQTAFAVAKDMGAKEILRVSRTPKGDDISYADAKQLHADAALLFNTTPIGMYPHTDGSPISLDGFDKLEGVFDAVYNPLRTTLVLEARERGIAAEGGLFMLVAQAFYAAEIFLGKKLDPALLHTAFASVQKDKENIVLIGMPASGKTTLGRRLASYLDRPLFDTDEEIVKRDGRSIPDIFEEEGESAFRILEAQAVASPSPQTNCVIATGGGAVLRGENVRLLSQNGRIYFLDRPLEMLMPTDDRPLASTAEAIVKRYNERYERYLSTADVRVENGGRAEDAAEKIIGDFI